MPDISYYLEKIPHDAPPEVRQRMTEEARLRAEEDVFGVGFKRDARGRPVEQGLGTVGNTTPNGLASWERHLNALERAEGKEAADRARAKAEKERAAPR